MEDSVRRAIAIVGVGAVLPDAPDAVAFWENVKAGRYSVGDVPPERWDPALYYDPDPRAPDKTYSRIGGFVREFAWDPPAWKLPIPPRVAASMDDGQKWAVACTRAALAHHGRPLPGDRTAVILGSAMAGERHYVTSTRISFPEIARELAEAPAYRSLPEAVRCELAQQLAGGVARDWPEITEDTMPGELANCMAGRIANLFDFHGPNYVCDAACASALAAISAAVEGLEKGEFDAVITGGIDRNMGAPTFVKFCKIGALSATGTRPYADGADGFVMGEGGVVFILKRLLDAERAGDPIVAVLRGIAGASDGRGKGITAPNPVGQRLAIERGWSNAGLSPATCSLVEGHGTSTRVGDVVEVESLTAVFGSGLEPGSIALGSVKSNIGHLKGAAGAAGLLKASLALRDRVLPPSLNFTRPNPNIDFTRSPFAVNTELREWPTPDCGVRRAAVSAFGFGGTNFHAVLEEYVPGRLDRESRRASVAVPAPGASIVSGPRASLRGAVLVGASSRAELVARLDALREAAEAGHVPDPGPPLASDLGLPERVGIDFEHAKDLAEKAGRAARAVASAHPGAWKPLRAKGVFRGSGSRPKLAFLYTGQGSQYVNMARALWESEPVVRATFDEADRVMAPLLGRPLSEHVFVDPADLPAVARAEQALKQTAITQPAVLATDIALTRVLASFGMEPDMVMGHSLGEYGALVAAGVLPFADALEAVSTRGREMTKVSVGDTGKMAAVFGPVAEIEQVLRTVEGYVVVANYNSRRQAVIGGATAAVDAAVQAMREAGFTVVALPVSHAFHTAIVASASGPLTDVLGRLRIAPPRIPVIANVTGGFYPEGPQAREGIVDLLGRQVASPVQFVEGVRTLFESGVRCFVEVGPKRALQGFVDEVLEDEPGVTSLYTNHPRTPDAVAINHALCGLWAAGIGPAAGSAARPVLVSGSQTPRPSPEEVPVTSPAGPDRYSELGRLFADFLERASGVLHPEAAPASPGRPVVISGAGLGLPGRPRVFDDGNVGCLLRGEQLIDVIPGRLRRAMADKHIVRLVKSDAGESRFEPIERVGDVIKLAARGGALDLVEEFGVSADRDPALDRVTRLAIGAGLDALRDAGLPLVMRYKTTSKGTLLPDRWGLPDGLRDETGVIFASAFPGYDSLASDITRQQADRSRRERLVELSELRERALLAGSGAGLLVSELDARIGEVRAALEREPFVFDRRFLFRILAMGHAQFAEHIGARGPNTQINAACASTTQAVALAEDWIRAGRCRRVVVISADDVTSDNLMEWIGAGFLASGAAATDEAVEDAALPFDRRRHGMLIGMGAAALVLESAEAARERGIAPICELLSSVTANSAFHGTRLDVGHIASVMETLVSQAEQHWGVRRQELAAETVFVSHETYTPARGGSASAEVHALRSVFREAADRIVVANTKGFTGHPMAVGIEDVVAVKALETGLVPPVANFKEVDPELGRLNLSRGGAYPVRYALRLAAGFGSQISMSLLRWVPTADGRRRSPEELGYGYRVVDRAGFEGWLARVAGRPGAALEVVKRTLRVRDEALAARAANGELAKLAPPAPQVAAALSPTAAPATQPVPAAAPVPAAPPAAAPAAASTGDPVRERVLALVTAKTGYPPDMLDPDLDLEADLGVDTVKQAELFTAVREEWGIPRDDKRKLRDYPTLNHVIGFVHEMRPDLAPSAAAVVPVAPLAAAPVPAAPPAAAPGAASTGDPVRERVLALVTAKTGYPPDMLDPDLDLEADLGVDTVKQAELFTAVREEWGIPRDDKRKLRDYPTLNHVIGFVHEMRPDLAPQAAAPAVVPAAPPAAAPAAESASDPVRERVLALVTAKTGYPPDMLDPELDLEADLGVDTVKQAELFTAVREEWGIPRDDRRKLRDYPTLNHVIGFVHEMRPDLAPRSEPAPAAPAEQPVEVLPEPAVVVPRRVALSLLRPSLARCKPTGVSLGAGSRAVLMADRGGVADLLGGLLAGRGVELLRIDGAPSAEELEERLRAFAAAGPVHGVYWLPALDAIGPIDALDLAGWREALRVRVKLAHRALRLLHEGFGTGSFLVCATRLGGRHGYDEAGAVDPLGGAVTGFAKAFGRERPDATVKAVDVAAEADAAEVASLLIEETLRDPGVVEVGHLGGLRTTVGLEERAAPSPSLPLGPHSVYVVTGAAGSIVAAILTDLARTGGTYHLLDLAARPDPRDPDLLKFASDREGLRRELFERLKARGERATPATIEKEFARLERMAAASAAIEAIETGGGRVHYHAVDLRDADAVAAALQQARAGGRVDVMMHAAGLEISRLLPDKEPAEFELVFDVKADGWFNLMKGLADTPLGCQVVFSSIAGRFGNGGQTDYSSANDLLCKLASHLPRMRPGARGIALDWTAWGEIGMASRGSIPRMMELAGIDMLPVAEGVPVVRREVEAGGSRELVVAGRLGVMAAERDSHGGLDVAALPVGPLGLRVVAHELGRGLRLQVELDPKALPFLDHHRIGGTPVLPGAMGIELFAQAASLALPDWRVRSVEDVELLAPFKFYRDEPRTVELDVQLRPDGDEVIAACRLRGSRQLPGQPGPQLTSHFAARVRLAREAEAARASAAPPAPSGATLGHDDIYRLYFHGPAYQVLDGAWRAGDGVTGLMSGALPPDGMERTAAGLAPRLLELCFQTAGVLEIARQGRMGLPLHVERVSLLRRPEAADGRRLLAMVAPRPDGAFDAEVVDEAGDVYLSLRGYRTSPHPDPIEAEVLRPFVAALA
jgi:acyl transferase domain-containing protein/acyl carrier protein